MWNPVRELRRELLQEWRWLATREEMGTQECSAWPGMQTRRPRAGSRVWHCCARAGDQELQGSSRLTGAARGAERVCAQQDGRANACAARRAAHARPLQAWAKAVMFAASLSAMERRVAGKGTHGRLVRSEHPHAHAHAPHAQMLRTPARVSTGVRCYTMSWDVRKFAECGKMNHMLVLLHANEGGSRH